MMAALSKSRENNDDLMAFDQHDNTKRMIVTFNEEMVLIVTFKQSLVDYHTWNHSISRKKLMFAKSSLFAIDSCEVFKLFKRLS